MYTVILISPQGTVSETTQPKAPDYEQLRSAVEGMIETVPHMTKFYQENGSVLKRGRAYVNEEGRIHGMPFNPVATRQWLLNLGSGPFRYEPRLYGPVLFYAKQAAPKQAKIKSAPPLQSPIPV